MTAARDELLGKLHPEGDPFAGFDPTGWADPTDELLLAFAGALLAAVLVLLRAGGPTAIIGAVALVVVYAVERVGGSWLVAHIGEEIHKGMTPAVANCNTPAAVVGVFGRIGVVAPVQHGTPRDVFGRSGIGWAVAMFGIALGHLFSLKAAATLATTNAQGASNQDAFCAAGASTTPKTLMICHVGEVEHRPSAKSLSGFIDAVRVCNVHTDQYTPCVVQ